MSQLGQTEKYSARADVFSSSSDNGRGFVNAIARGRRWLDEMVSGSATNIEQIAIRQKCSVRQVNMTISLAFLAPDLVKAAVEGRLVIGAVEADQPGDDPLEQRRAVGEDSL